MGSLHFLDTHWDHEPRESPLNHPPGTFSPTGGEGWDEGVRFMERIAGSESLREAGLSGSMDASLMNCASQDFPHHLGEMEIARFKLAGGLINPLHN
jgi:hypothetical protein